MIASPPISTLRSAGKNEKVVHKRERREAWTCVAPLYRPGYASQDVSPEESEAASSAGGSEQGSPHQQVRAGGWREFWCGGDGRGRGLHGLLAAPVEFM